MRFTQRSVSIILIAWLSLSTAICNQTFGQSPLSDWEGIWEGTMTSQNFKSELMNVSVELKIQPIKNNEWSWVTRYEENKEKKWPAIVKDYKMVFVDSTCTPFHLIEDNGFVIYFTKLENQMLGSFLVDMESGTDIFHTQYHLLNEQEISFTLTGYPLPNNKTVMGEMKPSFVQKMSLRKKRN